MSRLPRLPPRLQAWSALLQRYKTIFLHYWALRTTLRSDFFNQQEAAFLPAGLALQEKPGSASLRWTARVLTLLVLFVLLWAIFGRVDIIINASGKVIPSARTKTIASIDVASVRALHVSEGQQVRAGEVLIELDSSSSDAEHDKAQDSVAQSALQVARSAALIAALERGRPPRLAAVPGVSAAQWQAASSYLAGQYQDFYTRLVRLDGEIARYAQALPLATQRADDYRALRDEQAVAHHAWLEKEQVRIDLQGQLREVRNQRAALIAQTRREAHDAMTEGSKLQVAAQQDQYRSGVRSKLLKLTAPVDGTVHQLTVHTVGGVVPAAQALMQIVPHENFTEVEAFLENRDVGFVRVGQRAEVKIDAFDYTKYGTIDAEVQRVSQDAIEDEVKGLVYATKIVLAKNTIVIDGSTLPLAAGMSVNVAIKTGTRRVIEYVLSPLVQHQREALHER